MHKLIVLWVFLSFVGASNRAFGKESVVQHEPNMPPEIVACKSVNEVLPYLLSGDEVTRKWAGRKIGELGTEEGVQVLITAFDAERRKRGMENNPLVRMEIVRSLATIGGNNAKNGLLSILQKYLDEGPQCKRYAWEDREYVSVVSIILEGLGNWKDKDMLRTFEKIFSDEEIFWRLREVAYGEYLSIEMREKKCTTLKQKAEYLLDNLKGKGLDWVKSKNGVKTMEGVRNGAIVSKLTKYGEAVLPFIKEKLNQVSPTKEKERYEAIFYAKSKIEGLIRGKKRVKKNQTKN